MSQTLKSSSLQAKQEPIKQELQFLEVSVAVPLRRVFDFLPLSQQEITAAHIGCRLLVPFGNSKRVGILLAIKNTTDVEQDKLKPIVALLDKKPLLSTEILKLAQWSADYYHHPIGEVFNTILPSMLRQDNIKLTTKLDYWQLTELGKNVDIASLARAKRQYELIKRFQQLCPDSNACLSDTRLSKEILQQTEKKGWLTVVKKLQQLNYLSHIQIEKNWLSLDTEDSQVENKTANNNISQLILNEQQQQVVTKLNEKIGTFFPCLLFGITGSGKTEVYLQFIQTLLDQKKQVLILVPEINLTPQLFERFQLRFQVSMITLHSSMSDKERLINWAKAINNQAQIVIGTRSAIFTPMPNLGAIILDEEHDSSFKQQEGFRYHARDVAMMRAHNLKIPILLGTATPSLESLYNVKEKKYHCYQLTQRAANASSPKITLLDVRNKQIEHGISYELKQQISDELAKSNQVIIFQNRRGFAPVTHCHQCGWIARCASCDANLTTHLKSNYMMCHHCECKVAIPTYCPSCHSQQIEQLGAGTERIENSLQQLFPDIEIFRIDKDTTQGKDRFVKIIEQVKNGKKQILVGTQMLSKGHHFPNVTLVVILDVDQGLYSTDFRALEKTAQLIVQVAGRAGRAEKQGRVALQTHQPEHPFYRSLLSQGYAKYANEALQERQQMGLPPYFYYALIRCDAKTEQQASSFLRQSVIIANQLAQQEHLQQSYANIQLIGPVPAPMQRKVGRFRSQLLIQCQRRKVLQHFLQNWLIFLEQQSPQYYAKTTTIRWSVDVDLQDMSSISKYFQVNKSLFLLLVWGEFLVSIKKVPIGKLQQGMYLVGIDVSWMKSPFYKHCFMISSDNEILELKKVGVKIVDIDTEKSSFDFDLPPSVKQTAPIVTEERKALKATGISTELESAKKLESESKRKIKSAFDAVNVDDEKIDVEGLVDLVDQAHDSVLRNANALLALFHKRHEGEPIVDYAFNCMSMALLLGQRMDLSDKELSHLGTAALVMDIGWFKLPPALFKQGMEYTDEEYEQMQQHVDFSVEILEQAGFDSDIVDLVVKHHERVDGTGYYSNYTAEDIPVGAQILSLVDHYNSQVLGCYDSPAVIPATALRNIYKKANKGQHDISLVELLIQLVGIYPISSAVQLNSNEKAVVTKVNWRDALMPSVSIYYKKSGEALLTPKVVDLFRTKDTDEPKKIVSVLNPKNKEHDPAQILNFNP